MIRFFEQRDTRDSEVAQALESARGTVRMLNTQRANATHLDTQVSRERLYRVTQYMYRAVGRLWTLYHRLGSDNANTRQQAYRANALICAAILGRVELYQVTQFPDILVPERVDGFVYTMRTEADEDRALVDADANLMELAGDIAQGLGAPLDLGSEPRGVLRFLTSPY